MFTKVFLYVIGLHAVQFGNNWMRKIPRAAKLDSAYGLVQFGSPTNFFNSIISKLDKHAALLPINYIVNKCKIADFVKSILFQRMYQVQASLIFLFC